MLKKIMQLLETNQSFAFETTLAAKTYINLIQKAKRCRYKILLIYFWLNSFELAIARVKIRVSEGGHDIANHIIKRRYKQGLKNFFNLYLPLVDDWMFIDNSGEPYQVIAEGNGKNIDVLNQEIWLTLKQAYHEQ